jgi:hypothetical protein
MLFALCYTGEWMANNVQMGKKVRVVAGEMVCQVRVVASLALNSS